MMFSAFSHYLSYGATDQQTARDLTGDYDGLLVPGTVAAFQNDGTRGFVLTLSAYKHTPYTIDPRVPLFQQRLPNPKKSHESLAELLGVPALVNQHGAPSPTHFTDEWIQTIATSWLQFNDGYTTVSSKHFNKYAERLGEDVVPAGRGQGPERVLVPYTVASSPTDPWWAVSRRLWQAHVVAATQRGKVERLVRVVAANEATGLAQLLAGCDEREVAIWANALDELDVSEGGLRALTAYRDAIAQSTSSGKSLFALYGGFFAVLMSLYGLRGASHGIGYGEARTWVELPQSGPPPARFYLRRAHRYVSQDLAEYFWDTARDLVYCDCAECNGQRPGLLDYHGLMKHSVRCRQTEILGWTGRLPAEAAGMLRAEATEFRNQLAGLRVPRTLEKQANACFAHLEGWAGVLVAP